MQHIQGEPSRPRRRREGEARPSPLSLVAPPLRCSIPSWWDAVRHPAPQLNHRHLRQHGGIDVVQSWGERADAAVDRRVDINRDTGYHQDAAGLKEKKGKKRTNQAVSNDAAQISTTFTARSQRQQTQCRPNNPRPNLHNNKNQSGHHQ